MSGSRRRLQGHLTHVGLRLAVTPGQSWPSARSGPGPGEAHPRLATATPGLMCGHCTCRDGKEDGDWAEDMDHPEEEAGAAFSQRGLKPTEDRFMRLADMERFVRAAEQREMEDGDEDEELTGEDSGMHRAACVPAVVCTGWPSEFIAGLSSK